MITLSKNGHAICHFKGWTPRFNSMYHDNLWYKYQLRCIKLKNGKKKRISRDFAAVKVLIQVQGRGAHYFFYGV